MADLESIETWRAVVGWVGFYDVSDYGRVRSVDRRDALGRWWKGRVLRPYRNADGYLRVGLSREGATTGYLVHRLVLEAFVGPAKDGQVTCHNNGKPADNHVSNLRWDTQERNIRDSRFIHRTHYHSGKPTCERGHVLHLPNLQPHGIDKGQRICASCMRAHGYTHYHPELKPYFDQIADAYYHGRYKDYETMAANMKPTKFETTATEIIMAALAGDRDEGVRLIETLSDRDAGKVAVILKVLMNALWPTER